MLPSRRTKISQLIEDNIIKCTGRQEAFGPQIEIGGDDLDSKLELSGISRERDVELEERTRIGRSGCGIIVLIKR